MIVSKVSRRRQKRQAKPSGVPMSNAGSILLQPKPASTSEPEYALIHSPRLANGSRRYGLLDCRSWRGRKLFPPRLRGEMDQGILRFTWYSLFLVAKRDTSWRYSSAHPSAFCLAFLPPSRKPLTLSSRSCVPFPATWLPLGLVLFLSFGNKPQNSARCLPSRFAPCGRPCSHSGGCAGRPAGLFECGAV